MLLKLKQFIKGIETSSLIPMAAFVSIVAFCLWPLKSLSDTASLPCTMLAKSFCMFVLGCYVSEIIKGRISRKGFFIDYLERIWRKLEDSRYCRSKAHFVSYATTAYHCAWLKAHYPNEYKEAYSCYF